MQSLHSSHSTCLRQFTQVQLIQSVSQDRTIPALAGGGGGGGWEACGIPWIVAAHMPYKISVSI